MALVGVLSQIKLLFRPLVIQLVWYTLQQLHVFTSVSVSVEVIDNNYNVLKMGTARLIVHDSVLILCFIESEWHLLKQL